uniref:Immunoglobulin domain-containing protein n=1 Tax=Myripristis murdjan TaxID=586833 RepID=A0A667WGQ0_9TELE
MKGLTGNRNRTQFFVTNPSCLMQTLQGAFGCPPVSMGTEGEDVTCFYTWAKGRKKFFCKGTCKEKDILIETTQNRYQNGRYMIKDTRTGVFYVTITQLTKSDSGTYYCGVYRFIKDSYKEVKIEVQDGEFLLKMNLFKCSCIAYFSVYVNRSISFYM